MSRIQTFRLLYFWALTCFLAFPVAPSSGQEIAPTQQSVVVFDLRLDEFMADAESMGADLNDLDESIPTSDIFEGVLPSEFKRVYGSMSLPKKFEELVGMGIGMGLPLEFYVRVEFANDDACRLMAENIEFSSKEVELNGVSFWTPEETEIGVFSRKLNDTTIEFGSEAYVVHPDREFLTPGLEQVWRDITDGAIRVAVDLETPSGFIAEAVAMGSESQDPQTQAYLGLIDNLKTASLSADLESKNLLTMIADAIDTEQAEEVKSGLDSLLMLAQMAGKMGVGQLAKQAPESGVVANKVLEALNASQDGTVVKIVIPKPDGFKEAIAKLIEVGGNESASVNTEDNFRQIGLSIHNYFDTYKRFPFDVADQQGMNNELSWRVRVLPFIEELELYNQMDPSAGPTAEANANFAEKMPRLFGDNGTLANVVRIKSSVKGFQDVIDGTTNTIMLLEHPKGERWLESGGLSSEQAVALVTGLQDGEELIAVFYDGSSRKLSNKIKAETLKNLFDPRDGNVIVDFE